MEPRHLKIGDVVQFNPETAGNKAFGGCLGIVSEPKSFGAIVDVLIPHDRNEHPSIAPYRAAYAEIEYIGPAVFVAVEDPSE